MKKFYILVLCSLFVTVKANSQSLEELADRFFHSYGSTFLLDFYMGPLFEYPNGEDISFYDQISGTSLYTFIYTPRYNLVEMDDNQSLSVDVPLAISLYFSKNTVGSLNIPLFLSYNIGNVATYSSDMNKGFVVSAGLDYHKTGLYVYEESSMLEYAKNSWIQPAFAIGYRRWNKSNIASEINLKVGLGSTSTTYIERPNAAPTKVSSKTYNIRLSFHKFINY